MARCREISSLYYRLCPRGVSLRPWLDFGLNAEAGTYLSSSGNSSPTSVSCERSKRVYIKSRCLRIRVNVGGEMLRRSSVQASVCPQASVRLYPLPSFGTAIRAPVLSFGRTTSFFRLSMSLSSSSRCFESRLIACDESFSGFSFSRMICFLRCGKVSCR